VTTAYSYDRARLMQSVWMPLVVGLVFLIGGAAGGVFWIGVAAAGLCVLIALFSALQALHSGPVLTVDAQGFTYTPFSDAAVPWSNVAAVALVRREQLAVAWGKGSYAPQPQLDVVEIALRDVAPYPRSMWRSLARRVHRLNGLPAISIQTYFLQGASGEGIAEAIGAEWKGAIERRTVRYRA